MLDEQKKIVRFFRELVRCQLTLTRMSQKATLVVCSFGEHLCGSKEPRGFWEQAVLGQVWPGLRQGHGITEALEKEMGGWSPGYSRCSWDRGDDHPLNNACPWGHQQAGISPHTQRPSASPVRQAPEGGDRPVTWVKSKSQVQLLGFLSPTPDLSEDW